MGYHVNYEFENVKIKKEYEANCLKVINDLSIKTNNHKSLNDAFESWNFGIYSLDEYYFYLDNLDDFFDGNLGDENLLFEAIAPFVEHGGFIYGRGEDGELWRFAFIDSICREQQAKITYE